jgi:hypothetical protein
MANLASVWPLVEQDEVAGTSETNFAPDPAADGYHHESIPWTLSG